MERTLELTINIPEVENENEEFFVTVRDPESGIYADIVGAYMPDEHPVFNEEIGNEIFSWVSLMFDQLKEEKRMAKMLNDYRRDDIVSKLGNEIECVVRYFQDGYGIRNTEYTPEFVAELNIEIEAVADIIEKLLDFQTEIDNQKKFYTIGFKKQIKATNKEEALDILKGQIDSTFDIADLLSVEEIVEEMEVEE